VKEITEDIISKCRQGNRAAQKQLYYLSKDKYKNIALRYCSVIEDAQDVVQNTYLKIFKSIHQFDIKKASFYTWSVKILVNECIQKYRRSKKMDLSGLDTVPELSFISSNIDQMTIKEIRLAMNQLNDDYRIVLNMLFFEELTYKEMSELFKIKESSIRSKVTRARKQFKEIWSHQNMISYEYK